MLDSKELISALDRLERERKIKKEDIFKTIEDALVSALRKHIGKSAQISAVMDPLTGVIKATHHKKVVETVISSETEISLSEAKLYDKKAKLEDTIDIPIDITPFSRIAAQIAKQVLIQKIRDVERESIYKEYKPREGEVITGIARRFSDKDIVVDIGKAEGLLPYCEQIKRERYNPNSRVKGMILKVISQNDMIEDSSLQKYRPAIFKMDKSQKGPFIIISRAAPEFLQKLFEVEVPEVADKVVEIISIEREPGYRAKVVVKSNDMKVDPIGACVGMRGIRIKSITNELSGEKIDMIAYTIDAEQMIANSLSPAKVLSVKIADKESKKVLVTVAQDQLPIAIGKDWQNVKLASKISGWNIEIKSDAQVEQEGAKNKQDVTDKLSKVEGIGPKTAQVLIASDLTDINKLAGLTPENLATLQGIGEKVAEKIIEGAKKYIAEEKSETPAKEKAEDTKTKEENTEK